MPQHPGTHIFLSHSGADTQAARQLAEILRGNGHNVWFDKDDLLPGDHWMEQLEKAIHQASAMIVYIGRLGVQKWVDREVRLGLDLNTQDPKQFAVVPVLGPGSNPDNLPPFLKQHQCADLRDEASASEQVRRILEVLRRQPSRIIPEADHWREHSPFRGLQAFEPEHSWLFFGRDSATDQLLNLLGRAPVLGVVGNSGSGKSSLVKAGLIPALQRGRFRFGDAWVHSWRIAVFRPGEAPIQELAEALPQLSGEMPLTERMRFIRDLKEEHLTKGTEGLRNAIVALATKDGEWAAGTRVLLLADQFEELFTHTTGKGEVHRYIDILLAAAQLKTAYPVHLVLTVRGDFYSHCIDHDELGRHLSANQFPVSRMGHDQLCQAIEKPLAFAGSRPEPGLIKDILRDVGDEPGNLPLLEHALLELWERRQGQVITHKAYEEIGRISGALRNRADRVYESLEDPQRQDLARKIFLELTQIGEKSEDTRRRASKIDLMRLGEDEVMTAEVLNTLTDRRLVTTGSADAEDDVMAEVAHEALIREWPRLRRWLEESRDSLRYERRLTEKAEEWDSSGPKRHPDRLLRGEMLEEALKWEKLQKTPPSGAVKEFLAAGLHEVIVVDSVTGLMWTRRDNGEDIDWNAANEYARNLTLGGYSDWRLPTIEELEKLYDPEGGDRSHIRNPFRLTGWWVWSSTKEGSDSAWSFFFYGGERVRSRLDLSYSYRALCVRRSGE